VEKSNQTPSRSILHEACLSLLKNKFSLACILILASYVLVAFLAFFGLVGENWGVAQGSTFEPPSMQYLFGTDIFGRDVLSKLLKGTQVAVSVGVVTVLISIPLGVFFGALSGYFGGWIDECIVWFYTTISSIPSIMLLISITFILGKGLLAMYIALGLTSWVGLCRMIRAEVMKHKSREYVTAAETLGASHFRRLFIHILPNVYHIVIIDASLTFQMAIKSEVILSYMGLGVQDLPSWGKMIDDSKSEIQQGVWWQLAAASLAMFVILLALNFLGDMLRDALDPKLKGKG
jgi:peptide/nickel transport system permease protein